MDGWWIKNLNVECFEQEFLFIFWLLTVLNFFLSLSLIVILWPYSDRPTCTCPFTHLCFNTHPSTCRRSVKVLVTQPQSCPTLGDAMDWDPPGSSVHGILQARTLEWAAISFSRGSSRPRDRAWVCCTAGRLFTVWPPGKPPHKCVHTYMWANTYMCKCTCVCVVQYTHTHTWLSM